MECLSCLKYSPFCCYCRLQFPSSLLSDVNYNFFLIRWLFLLFGGKGSTLSSARDWVNFEKCISLDFSQK